MIALRCKYLSIFSTRAASMFSLNLYLYKCCYPRVVSRPLENSQIYPTVPLRSPYQEPV